MAAAFLIMLGLNQTNRVSDAVGQWKRLKNFVLSGEKVDPLDKTSLKLDAKDIYSRKKSHCTSWMQTTTEFFTDSLPSGIYYI